MPNTSRKNMQARIDALEELLPVSRQVEQEASSTLLELEDRDYVMTVEAGIAAGQHFLAAW